MGATAVSGGHLLGQDPQTQLRIAFRNQKKKEFQYLLENGTVDINFYYGFPDYKTCLDLAASEPNKISFLKILLQHKADVNKMNKLHNRTPLHFAVENANIEAVKALLEDENIEVNTLSKSNSALLIAIKMIDDIDEDGAIKMYEEIVECLLKAGVNPNIPDLKGVTALYSAAKQGLENIVKLILEYSKYPLDIDTYKDIEEKTARMIIKEKCPNFLDRFAAEGETETVIDANILFYHISKGDEKNFVKDFNNLRETIHSDSIFIQNNGSYTILQFCCYRGSDIAVSTLLTAGADPNSTAPGNSRKPITLACTNGHANILKMLVDHDGILIDSNDGEETLLQIVAKEMKKGILYTKSDYKKCLYILLNHPKIKINVNSVDSKDNTALHYAARNGDQDAVLALLRKGACIGLRNKFNEPPLADIPAKTLEVYLDECVSSNSERPIDEDYEIHIKYNFLVYPNNSLENEECKIPLMDNSNNNIPTFDQLLAPETDALLYMTRSQELKHLLKHPVITSFLYLKWQRISCLFYGNLLFYTLLWISLIIYVLYGYSNESSKSKFSVTLAYVGLVVGLFVLITRETFQLVVSPRRYSQNVENWVEILLIIVTAKIVFDSTVSEHTKQQLSAVAILLSSAELVLLIGKFPRLSTNIVMLKTVSWNFLKFLLWYCILIIAFALSFYTLFRTPLKKANNESVVYDPNKEGEQTEKKETNFFSDPGMSLFKTIVMLTGEFDTSSIKFDIFPITSHIIFIIFVFMVPIVLFNLLNGLAVSDTQRIKEDAELVGHISRIQLISYFESILLGRTGSYKYAFDPPKNGCHWIPNTTFFSSRLFFLRPLAKRICLFPDFLPKQAIIVKPNQSNRIVIPKNEAKSKQISVDYEDVESGNCFFRQCQIQKLEPKVVKDAKLVIYNKTNHSELDEIRDRLIRYEEKIDSLEEKIDSFGEKFDNFILTFQSKTRSSRRTRICLPEKLYKNYKLKNLNFSMKL